jgi:hypothetical protein
MFADSTVPERIVDVFNELFITLAVASAMPVQINRSTRGASLGKSFGATYLSVLSPLVAVDLLYALTMSSSA